MQLQLLTAIVKLFLKKPTETQELVQQVLSLATQVRNPVRRCSQTFEDARYSHKQTSTTSFESLKTACRRPRPLLRTLTTRTFGTAATSTGACCPQTLWLLRRWFWPRSRWFQKRRIWLNPHCWRSSSAILALWPLSTTSPPAPSLRAAVAFSTKGCPSAVDRKCASSSVKIKGD